MNIKALRIIREVATIAITAAFILAGLFAALQLTGCTTQLPWRDADCAVWAEVNDKTVEDCKARILKKEEREYARDREIEDIIMYRIQCRKANMLVVYDGWQGPIYAMKSRKDSEYVPKHARLRDYRCITREQFQDMMRRAGFG